MIKLVQTAIGPFRLESGLDLEAVDSFDKISEHLCSIHNYFSSLLKGARGRKRKRSICYLDALPVLTVMRVGERYPPKRNIVTESIVSFRKKGWNELCRSARIRKR